MEGNEKSEERADSKDSLERCADGGFRLECKAGQQYSICTCGASGNLPFCDNSHREVNADLGTTYKSLKICPNEDVVIYFSSSNWKKG